MFSATVDEIASTPRVLVYTSEAFESDTEMIGSGQYTLYAGSATSDTVDLIVRVFDVARDGSEIEVTAGAARVTGLAPGEVRRVEFQDFGDHWLFRAGHQLRLKITNIDFPDFRPPGSNDNLPSEISVRAGKAFPSVVRLPIRNH
jgi:predicted acyl esterase